MGRELKVFDFLRKKSPEIQILDLMENHLSICVSATRELVRAIENVWQKEDSMEDCFEKISDLESQADDVRREIVKKLAEGVLPPFSKEDLMTLAWRQDMIGDWSKESSKLLRIVPSDELTLDLKESFLQLASKGSKCSQAVFEVLKLLYQDWRKAIDKCSEVERLESEIDELYIRILEALFNSDLKPQTLFLANELARTLENLGDSCEDTSDLMKIVAVSTYH